MEMCSCIVPVAIATHLPTLTGANIEAQTEETQETALTLACCGGFLSVVQVLRERGAGLEQGASTPIMEAAQEGHYEVVQYLIHQGGRGRAGQGGAGSDVHMGYLRVQAVPLSAGGVCGLARLGVSVFCEVKS